MKEPQHPSPRKTFDRNFLGSNGVVNPTLGIPANASQVGDRLQSESVLSSR
ncbi:hypothetical protein [Neosynechococcus sphagnicola]|uniref:hypothetical protein n=1 Tax=Neosynechococcus sphagnicola TaxID=1501145 RepID=UPI0012E03751|nr:hypothetical protein [Neosynechococcus sphagnicola]